MSIPIRHSSRAAARRGLLIMVAALALNPAAVTASAPPPGFQSLFNGRDLSGWWGLGTEDPARWQALSPSELGRKKEASLADIRRHWRVEGDELVNDGEGLYLTTEEDYGDFELLIDYRTVPGADSGIYLRGIPQVQIWDSRKAGGKWGGDLGAEYGSGGLWNNSKGKPGKNPLVAADKPLGEWNKFRILMLGERVTVFLNDQLLVDHARLENYFDRKKPIPTKGPIQLQTHGGEIRWRNLFIRSISPAEANRRLRQHDRAEGFYPILSEATGTQGWGGPIDEYEWADAVLRCKPGKGGTVFYQAQNLRDFTVLFEFLLPPGGNNGLAIRYPGQGDAAYHAMCELQVLDDTADKYATLDPRQYHGSAYGMVASHRGYQRPVGQWNYQRVTVRGPRIEVELNGTRILDADLSKVTEYMSNTPHPGKDRPEGYFGFAGHGDPVAFRLVELREE
jgi:hypothetical protein